MTIRLTHAQAVIERACAAAAADGLAIAAVVVDVAGHPVAAARMDGAPFVALELAREKAWTAAAFGAPTAVWRQNSAPGGPYWGLANAMGGRLAVLTGGAPLRLNDHLVGAVGVSGGDDEQDHRWALHAATETT